MCVFGVFLEMDTNFTHMFQINLGIPGIHPQIIDHVLQWCPGGENINYMAEMQREKVLSLC